MNRNTNSHFAENPQASIQRSKMARHNGYKTTADAGKLFVFHVDEVLPGDTFEVSTSSLARMATPAVPVMDNAYLDYYYFFVPMRLTWEHFENFMGASESKWDSEVVYRIPQLTVPSGGFKGGSLADYFGIPTLTAGGATVNALPFRAYRKIWNDWFRDVNLMDEVMLNLGDDGDTNPDEDYELWDLLPVSKLHDYFTTGLPAPQRGQDVYPFGDAIVFASRDVNDFSSVDGFYGDGLRWENRDNLYGMNSYNYLGVQHEGSSSDSYLDTLSFSAPAGSSYEAYGLYPSNLKADTSSLINITELRTAFAIQRMFETDARGGNRYTEILRSHFGVVSPDGRLQRSEYLGGKRVPIGVQDVVATATTLGNTELGSPGAVSKTVDSSGSFTRSFTEHGYLIGVACIRTDRTYQQGLNRMWSRKDRFDFYWSEFNGVGDQPIYNSEIFFTGKPQDEEVFAYQERYAEYRFYPSMVTGAFRSNWEDGTLDYWHYADDYDSLPKLSKEWIVEDTKNLQRSLAIQSDPEDLFFRNQQFLLDFYIHKFCTRPMPVYSMPGMNPRF